MNSITYFENLGDDAGKNYPQIVDAEVINHKLYTLPAEVVCQRCWRYWRIKLPKSNPIPKQAFLKFNQLYGQGVRAFGYAGGLDGNEAFRWFDKEDGITMWDVDTYHGLDLLVEFLQEFYKIEPSRGRDV